MTTVEDKMDWRNRAKYWSDTAPEGRSQSDRQNQFLIEAAKIKTGDRVLDIASGTGDPAISIALHVGNAGHVTGFDASEVMLAAAEKRAQRLDLANIEFRVGRMESLPFEDGAFDAVTCRFGLMHCDDAAAAVAEARRVLKPGASAAFMVHGPVELNTLYPLVRKAVFEFLGEEDTGGAARRFRFSTAGELEAIFQDGGFREVAETEISETVERPVAEFWSTMLQRGFGAKIEPLSQEQRGQLNVKIKAALEPCLKADHYELLSSERLVSGIA
jgi:ubiquinone/menaquinone biosynthesis C-methylase UbiE